MNKKVSTGKLPYWVLPSMEALAPIFARTSVYSRALDVYRETPGVCTAEQLAYACYEFLRNNNATLHLVPQLVAVFTAGLEKYAPHDFRVGIEHKCETRRTYVSALMRHAFSPVYLDDETAVSHSVHVLANALILLDNELRWSKEEDV